LLLALLPTIAITAVVLPLPAALTTASRAAAVVTVVVLSQV
jgi:hypothetical protein